jgi:hypothetical protein
MNKGAVLALPPVWMAGMLIGSRLWEVGRGDMGASNPFLSMVPSFVIETLVTWWSGTNLDPVWESTPEKTTWPAL